MECHNKRLYITVKVQFIDKVVSLEPAGQFHLQAVHSIGLLFHAPGSNWITAAIFYFSLRTISETADKHNGRWLSMQKGNR